MVFSAKTRACIFFTNEAEQAVRFYVSVIPNSSIENVVRADREDAALVVEFSLAGTPYMALNGNPSYQSDHSFSISVLTDDQTETDALWGALLKEGGTAGQCGWLRDRFGLHWQIVPKALPILMSKGGRAAANVQAALMNMSKIDIAALEIAALQ